VFTAAGADSVVMPISGAGLPAGWATTRDIWPLDITRLPVTGLPCSAPGQWS
jgi:hypothetical protein